MIAKQIGIRSRGFAAMAIAVLASSCLIGCGCQAQIKIVSQEEKEKLDVKELNLPPEAKNVVKMDSGWHTFELVIDGRTRKFLRRYVGGGWMQSNNCTDSFTELTPQ